MTEKVKVTIRVSERITYEDTVEMSREKFEKLDKLEWIRDRDIQEIANCISCNDRTFVDSNNTKIEDFYLCEDSND